MKNMMVGTRILVGFLAILFIVAVLSGVVIVTNLGLNDRQVEIDNLSKFQTKTNSLIHNFDQARRGAATIYISISDEAYKIAKDALALADVDINDLNEMIASQPSLFQFSDNVGSLATMISEWTGHIDAIQAWNTELAKKIDDVVSAGEGLTALSDEVYGYHLSELSSNISLSTPSQVSKRFSKLKDAYTLAENISTVRRGIAKFIFSMDDTGVETYYKLADDTIALVSGMINDNSMTHDAQREKETLDTFSSYIENVKQFEAINKNTNDASTLAKGIAQDIYAVSDDLIQKVDNTVASDISASIAASNMSLMLIIILSAVAIIASMIMAFVIKSSITKPIAMMKEIIDQVGTTGSLDFSEEKKNSVRKTGEYRDEISQSIRAFVGMMDRLIYVSDNLKAVASGDLSVQVELLSEQDSMGNALVQMVEHLNSMFEEIHNSSTQVSFGAKQIADGSQALAQGATEQAASVEELSASISQVAHSTKDNARMASEASSLSDAIKQNAERGSAQMDEMVQAVHGINEASRSIGKIIKVIDDIAFQTNILALNAAVEAARAGQHGKGFAVVAEEVRNLAAKSAEAAKDTGSMIADSIKRAELGARIAEETARSLSDIVNGINNNNAIVADIARASDEQSQAISQISVGIDQVSEVVQQNSSTAEESAAASEELSGQSALTQELISRFKLRDSGMRPLPSGPVSKSEYTSYDQSGTSFDTTGYGKY